MTATSVQIEAGARALWQDVIDGWRAYPDQSHVKPSAYARWEDLHPENQECFLRRARVVLDAVAALADGSPSDAQTGGRNE
jgi:hypothetical protein